MFQESLLMGEINSIPVLRTAITVSDDLPEKKNCAYYIVSQLVASSHPERDDLLFPSDNIVRNASGAVIGARDLGKI